MAIRAITVSQAMAIKKAKNIFLCFSIPDLSIN